MQADAGQREAVGLRYDAEQQGLRRNGECDCEQGAVDGMLAKGGGEPVRDAGRNARA